MVAQVKGLELHSHSQHPHRPRWLALKAPQVQVRLKVAVGVPLRLDAEPLILNRTKGVKMSDRTLFLALTNVDTCNAVCRSLDYELCAFIIRNAEFVLNSSILVYTQNAQIKSVKSAFHSCSMSDTSSDIRLHTQTHHSSVGGKVGGCSEPL